MHDRLEVAFYSDFNCPYCHGLNERLLALGENGQTAWRGIEHMPGADSTDHGLEVQLLLSTDVAVVRRRAPEVEITVPTFIPNTAAVNRMVAALAERAPPARLWPLRTAIYRAYWRDGLDISDAGVLGRVFASVGMVVPAIDAGEAGRLDRLLSQWQAEWESERFRQRLPALLSQRGDKPLLGFPTLDLLYAFFSDTSVLPHPETMAACELRARQQILVAGDGGAPKVQTRELDAPYAVRRVGSADELHAVLDGHDFEPDLVVIDVDSYGEHGPAEIARIRRDPLRRTLPVVALLSRLDAERELHCFDAGATDVVFDLSNPKVAQARLELHLRLHRSTSLLQNMACFDYLTELANRREFDRRFEAEWSRCRRARSVIALCLVDIDYFKRYNDTYGHDAGDDCLRQVAAAIRSAVRRPGDLVARFGGEEFIILLTGTDLEGAAGRAEAIVRSVRELELPHIASTAAPVVTVSAGVSAVMPTEQMLPTQLLLEADAALYRAKDAGRNRWVRGEVPRPMPAHTGRADGSSPG